MHYNCLIVDDEDELAKMTAEYFNMFDVKTQYVDSAAACYAFFEQNEADIVLLDINLGDGSGFEVCKKLRESFRIPIMFISARQSDDDVLVALSIGGDDYVKKPYSLSVLLAKVKVNLNRLNELKKIVSSKSMQNSAFSPDKTSMSGSLVSESSVGERTTDFDSKQSIFPEADGFPASAREKESIPGTDGSPASARVKDDKFGADGTSEPINREKTSFELDGSTMSVLLDGERISLKAKEYALLKCLYDHKNTIVTKEVLFSEVWGDAFFTDGTLNVHIRKLREKIENDPNSPKIIKTVWGTGYILEI